MQRQEAVQLVRDLLHRLDDGRGQRPLSLVTEIRVFGSFASGALQPNDVDLIVLHDRDDEWIADVVYAMSYGKDPYVAMRRGLTGGKRRLQIQFGYHEELMRDSILLWAKGDTLGAGLARLDSIEADETAQRAPRDAMLPAFEEIDHLVPRGVREALNAAVMAGAVKVKQIVLADQQAKSALATRHISHRWAVTSPLHRAGHAILAYFEGEGIDPAAVHLYGKDVASGLTSFFAGMEFRYWRSVKRCLTRFEGQTWLEVPRPTRKTTLGRAQYHRARPQEAQRRRPVIKRDWDQIQGGLGAALLRRSPDQLRYGA